jgi:hypothetical protein
MCAASSLGQSNSKNHCGTAGHRVAVDAGSPWHADKRCPLCEHKLFKLYKPTSSDVEMMLNFEQARPTLTTFYMALMSSM